MDKQTTRRKVFSSLSHRKVKKKHFVRSLQKPRTNTIAQGHAVKVYLQDMSIIPRKQLESMLRTAPSNNTKANMKYIEKIYQELERRNVDDRFRCMSKSWLSSSGSIPISSRKKFTFKTIEEEINKTSTQKSFENMEFLGDKEDLWPDEQQNNFNDFEMRGKEIAKFTRSYRYPRQKIEKKQRKKFPNSFLVCNKGYFVKKYLQSQGWRQLSPNSDEWTIKWVQQPRQKDFNCLKKCNKGTKICAFYNHIQGNSVIGENGIGKIRKGLEEREIKCNSFIPTRFCLPSERDKFLAEYTNSLILALIRKHIQHFQNYKLIKQDSYQDPSSLMKTLRTHMFKNFMNSEPEQATIHLPLLIYTLLHSLNLYYISEGIEDKEFEENYGKVLADTKIMGMLFKYGQTNLPLKQLMGEKSEEYSVYVMEIKQKNGYIKMKNPFLSPSTFTIACVMFFHNYFMENISYYGSVTQNKWVLQCPYKGSGFESHELVGHIKDINHLLEKKSVSSIIYRDINNLYLVEEANNSELLYKPFSIRQWILVYPPQIYVFSHFVVKILQKGKEKPPFHQFINHSMTTPPPNLISERQFEQILNSFGNDFSQVKTNVLKVTKAVAEEILYQLKRPTSGCFDVMSVEMKIDKSLQPWVIGIEQVQIRGVQQWQRQMYQSMIASTLQIVLGERVKPIINSFFWNPIILS